MKLGNYWINLTCVSTPFHFLLVCNFAHWDLLYHWALLLRRLLRKMEKAPPPPSTSRPKKRTWVLFHKKIGCILSFPIVSKRSGTLTLHAPFIEKFVLLSKLTLAAAYLHICFTNSSHRTWDMNFNYENQLISFDVFALPVVSSFESRRKSGCQIQMKRSGKIQWLIDLQIWVHQEKPYGILIQEHFEGRYQKQTTTSKQRQ